MIVDIRDDCRILQCENRIMAVRMNDEQGDLHRRGAQPIW